MADLLYDKNILGGWFFFKKGDSNCRSCIDLIHSLPCLHDLAMQLCSRFQWHKHLSQSLINDPDMAQRGLAHQVRTLIAEPLKQERNRAAAAGEQMKPTFLVIDALDECIDKDVEDMVQLLADVPGIRCLIAARSEVYPQPLQFDGSPEVCDLDRQDREHVRAEIKSYLTHEINRCREDWNEDYPGECMTLASDWPGEDVINRLTDDASPLFIIAAKMVEILESDQWDLSHKEKIRLFLEEQVHRVVLGMPLSKDTLPELGKLDSPSSRRDHLPPI